MGTAYTRQSSFSDGDTITAALFNDEYNQLLTSLSYAASGTTGHQHDGTAGEGGNVHSIGDQDFLNKIVADSTNNRWGVFVEVSSSAVEQIRISDGVISPVTDNDVDLGTSSLEFKDLFIDGTAHIDTLDVDVNATVAGTLGVTGALTGSSTIQGTTITATTAFVPDASDGAALGTSALEFSDLFLADGAVINFGADQDVTITHVADTGILLSSTDQLQFGDSGTYIYQSADGVLDLVSDTEIELTATTIDINGAVVMDGAITGGTNITISGELDAATLDISGNADIDGTTNLDAVDIDGAVQIDATVTVGEDDTGYDVKFFGDTASAYMLWDTSADDLILGGAARVVVPASGLVIGSTAVTSTAAELNILDGVTSTAAELNIIDGDTSATNTTLADADRVVVNDAGTMKQVALTDFETYFESSIDTFSTIDINGGSIDGATLGTNSAITQAVIDDIDLNGKVITMTGSASDTAVFTAGTNGTLSIITTDAAAAAANIQITADGTVDIDSAGVLTLDSGAAINIEPASGSAILLDGTISIDAGVVTGATSITSTAFVGDITGDVTGNADTATLATTVTVTDNANANETMYFPLIDGLTGSQGLESDANIIYNPSTNTLTVGSSIVTTSFTGNLTGNVTGNASGTAATVTGAAQAAITSLGTLTTLTVDDITINGTTIYATDLILGEDAQTAIDFGTANEIDFKVDNAARLTLTASALYPVTDNQIDLGTSSLEFKDAFFDGTVTADAFAGPLTGNVTGNASGTAATVTTAAQTNITSLGTLNALTVDDVAIDGKVVTMTGSPSDTAVFTAGTNGTLSIVTTDAAAAAANITITADGTFEADGTTITLDSAGDIILDADGADVIFKDGGTAILTFTNSSSDAVITSGVQDKDIIFKGDDGGSPITALTLDMSDAGAATFNNKIVATELDISGNIDIDGTANLDAVDVEGAANFAADVTFADGADIITASAGTSNFRAGVNAGNSIASGGNYNVVVGDEAGTAITTGDNNTAVGYAALDTNETGVSNVAIGYEALSATTTSYGTAVGHQALAANTTGANNTAVGYAALTNNDGAGGGGDYNTAIGYGALYTNTEGNTCTGVGYYAGFNNTTGLGNTAIGYYANGAVTDGDYNTGLGMAAGDSITTGNYNVCVGYGTDVSTAAAANQISIGTSVVCSENSQVSIGSSGSNIRNEFDTDNEWNFSSDVRKKKNIEDAVLGLDFVNDLRPVTYEWKPNYEFPEDFAEYSEENHMTLGVRMHGLVAQEVKVALDKTGVERFSGWKEDPNGSQRISKEAFVIPLIKAVKELSAKNDALEARIAALESA